MLYDGYTCHKYRNEKPLYNSANQKGINQYEFCNRTLVGFQKLVFQSTISIAQRGSSHVGDNLMSATLWWWQFYDVDDFFVIFVTFKM